jgi:uncharacterized protein
MARLRGHHLVCLYFFEGDLGERAYGLAREGIRASVEAGESVEVVNGADDLCASCPHLTEARCTYKDGAEEEIRNLDRRAADYLGVSAGVSIAWQSIGQRVIDAPGVWFSQFCDGCDWRADCRRGR